MYAFILNSDILDYISLKYLIVIAQSHGNLLIFYVVPKLGLMVHVQLQIMSTSRRM